MSTSRVWGCSGTGPWRCVRPHVCGGLGFRWCWLWWVLPGEACWLPPVPERDVVVWGGRPGPVGWFRAHPHPVGGPGVDGCRGLSMSRVGSDVRLGVVSPCRAGRIGVMVRFEDLPEHERAVLAAYGYGIAAGMEAREGPAPGDPTGDSRYDPAREERRLAYRRRVLAMRADRRPCDS